MSNGAAPFCFTKTLCVNLLSHESPIFTTMSSLPVAGRCQRQAIDLSRCSSLSLLSLESYRRNIRKKNMQFAPCIFLRHH